MIFYYCCSACHLELVFFNCQAQKARTKNAKNLGKEKLIRWKLT